MSKPTQDEFEAEIVDVRIKWSMTMRQRDELADQLSDLQARVVLTNSILRELMAEIGDETDSEGYRIARARGVLEAVTDELTNASTPIVLAGEDAWGQQQ